MATTSKAQADGIGRRFSSDRAGFLFGADMAINSFTFGGLFSYVDSDVDLARLDKSNVRSVGGAVADNRFKHRPSITVPGVE